MTKPVIYKIICPNRGKEYCEGTFIRKKYNKYHPSWTKYCTSCISRNLKQLKEEAQ